MNLLWSWVSLSRISWFGFTITLELNIVLSVVEGGVGLSDLWIKDMDLFWLKNLNFSIVFLSWLFTDLGSSLK
jgi:hypothetical protein